MRAACQAGRGLLAWGPADLGFDLEGYPRIRSRRLTTACVMCCSSWRVPTSGESLIYQVW